MKIVFQTELILCDRNENCYFEADFTLVKSPIPYEIPLNCLLSIYNLPQLDSINMIDEYTEANNFGINIYKLSGNKAELSANFPGKKCNLSKSSLIDSLIINQKVTIHFI